MPKIQQVIGDMQSIAKRDAHRNADGKRRLPRAGAMAVLLTSVALAAGACGSSGEPKKTVASVAAKSGSASTAATGKADMLAYAKCMREHGMPNFPDPKPGGGLAFKPGGAMDPTSPEFKKVESHCKQFMGPAGPVQQNPAQAWSSADKLKYSQCMRTNGAPKFPDPGSDGNFPPLGGGVDPESPQFKKADAACKKYQPQGVRNAPKAGPGGGA